MSVMRERYVTLLDHGPGCVRSAEPRARLNGDEAETEWTAAEGTRLPICWSTWLDARRGCTDHPRSREGQELPLDTLGQLVGRYLRWFRNEYGATESTLRDYEAVLARMSLT